MRADKESLAIPAAMRAQVDARDHEVCRVCGIYQGERRALHHIEFGGDARGMGGRRVHELTGIITVCWFKPGNCHTLVHSDKARWQPLLRAVVSRPGVTAMQLARWQRRRQLLSAS